MSFCLSEDLTSLGAGGKDDAPAQVPRDHPFRMHAVGGQTLLVYSQTDTGQHQSPCPPPSSEAFGGGGYLGVDVGGIEPLGRASAELRNGFFQDSVPDLVPDQFHLDFISRSTLIGQKENVALFFL